MISDSEIGTVVFTDVNGVSRTIKDIRPIEPSATFKSVPLLQGELLDSVAVRSDVYGENAENQVYKIHDMNAALIIDNNFDLSNVRSLRIGL